MPLDLSTPVKYIKRIGERVAANLAERGVETVEDLLYHLPFRYEDRLHPKPLSSYNAGEMASLVGEVRGAVLLRTRSAPIFEITVGIQPPAIPVAQPANPGAPLTNLDAPLKSLGDPLTNLGAPLIAQPLARWVGPHDATAPPPPSLILTPSPILETVKCLWFHGTYLNGKLRPGQTIALYGKLEGSRSGNALHAPPGSTRFKMVQPTFEILPDASATGEDAEFTMLEMGRIVPIYESLGGTNPWGAKLTSRWLRRVLWTVFRDLVDSATPVEETLPHELLERLHLPTRMKALQDVHFPPAGTSMTELMSARTPAHRRLIFEEFWYLELGLELKRRKLRNRQGTAFLTGDKVREALKQVLPFKPTAAQKRVLGEIVADMRSPRPMRRLLQGDVGSGKTIVAFQAALVAIENGYQAALMAPTEILATQHYLSAKKLLSGVLSPTTGRPYRITLLAGSLDERSKRDARARIFSGEADLAIGTHALVEEKVDFANLGLVIVDEQHRFGVQQRFQLMRKPSSGVSSPQTVNENSAVPNKNSVILSGASQPYREAQSKDPEGASPTETASSLSTQNSSSQGRTSPEPDTLVMTATPIPRTLALTLYGDLDASVIDELPPGRTPIVTRRIGEDRSSEVWDFVRKQVAAGRQAYIVYPIIEGEKDDQPELDFAADPAEPLAETAPVRLSARKQKSLHQKTTKTPSKLRSATAMYDWLRTHELAGLRLGLLHGRMSADDKEVAMACFKHGETNVLVATTVIEVGVDVTNATIMVIEHAERFGLAQLHQLRGRVGRGKQKSYCVLLTGSSVSPEAENRLNAMVNSQNGFDLAELDLAQRGPGEFFGTRQAGLPNFHVANILRDRDLLEQAKKEAAHFVAHTDTTIPRAEIDAVWARLKHQWQRRYGLVEA